MTARAAATSLTLAAIALRVGFVLWTAATPGFTWIDPDGYLDQARLFHEGRTLDAFRYFDFFKAPLYPVFLALCEHLPGAWPLNAAIAQAVLAGCVTWPVFAMSRRLASTRVACLVAAAYVIYFPSIMALMTLMQERVYVPLLAFALAALVRAADVRSVPQAAGAGVCLGLAALARSMPIYFAPVAALWFLVTPRDRGRLRLATVFLAAFVTMVTPYSIWLSAQAGRTILVEDIGSYGFARLSPEGREYFGDEMPTVVTTAAFLWRKISASPAAFAGEIAGITGGMFQVPGGSWLEEHGHARTRGQARWMKVHAAIGGDVLFTFAAVFAAIGIAWGRARRPIAILAVWIGLHLFLTALSGYGGQRFREPIDVSLFALSAAGLGVPWRRGWWRWLVVAVLITPVIAGLRSSWREAAGARSDYGVLAWHVSEDGRAADLRLPAGFNSTQPGRRIEVVLTSPAAVHARVFVNGYEVATRDVSQTAQTVSVPHAGGRVFIEIDAGDVAGPVEMTVAMRGHR